MTAPIIYPEREELIDPRFDSLDCLFFVIGAQKAGTTWLSHYFRAHPNVAVPYWKEHNYWNMVEGKKTPGDNLMHQAERQKSASFLRRATASLSFTRHAKRQRAITLAIKAANAPRAPYSAYADVILESTSDATRAAGELCPQYALLKADTFRKMASLSGNTRFIYILRDPVSRTISGALHNLRKRHKAAHLEDEDLYKLLRKLGHKASKKGKTHSNYDRTIQRLEMHVPPDQIKYVFFENMFEQEQLQHICAFLDVPFVKGNVERKRNPARGVTLRARDEDRVMLARALKPVYDFAQERFGASLPTKWQESAALC